MTRGKLSMAALCVVLVALLVVPAIASAVNPVSFSRVGNMTTEREGPGAALLPDGRVLVVGGFNPTKFLDTAETFDPKTNTFSALAGRMEIPHTDAGVASLPDGRVLIAGGGFDDLSAAEVFDPSSGSFRSVAPMDTGRQDPIVATLPDGRILIGAGRDADLEPLSTSEIFDPAANTWSPGPSLPELRTGSGSAGIAGGRTVIAAGADDDSWVTMSRIFDPSSGSFTAAAAFPAHVLRPAAASLPQGRAIIAAGYDDAVGAGSNRAFIYDPATNSFSTSGIGTLTTNRDDPAGVELKDGRVLIVGGVDGSRVLDTAEVLSVPSNSFKAKLKGRNIKFSVTTEGVAQVTDVSTKVATTAKKKKKKKPKLVKTTSVHGGPGTIVVKVKLTKAGSTKLRQKGKLKAQVVYTPDQGLAATKKLKLRAGK